MPDQLKGMIARESRRNTVCCCDGNGFFAVDVPSSHPLFGQAIPCVCQRSAMARARAERLRTRSGMSAEAMLRWTFSAYDPARCVVPPDRDRETTIAAVEAVKRACEAFAQEPTGWLILSGAVGTGKSHLAHAIGATALQNDIACYAATAPDLLDMLRATYAEGVFDKVFSEVRDVSLLIIDDMGTQKGSEWATEKLFQIVDHRYRAELPMVVTTNIRLGQGKATGIDRRILSRLLDGSEVEGGLVRIFALPVMDYRRQRRAGRRQGEK